MQLDPIHLHSLLDHAAGHADEVCGVLLGRSDPWRLTAIVPGRNIHPQPQHHFLLDAATLLAADAQARTEGDMIIGFYHSHPNGGAVPSRHDRADAWPEMIMLIMACDHGRPRYACAWIVDNERVTPEPLALIRDRSRLVH